MRNRFAIVAVTVLAHSPAWATGPEPVQVTVRQHTVSLLSQLPRLETAACQRAHPAHQQDFDAGLQRFLANLDQSLVDLQTQRAAELATVVPAALL
ncbi:MAG: hypothetical protein ACRC6L_15475, partial [Steroidobacteraceae bacterium]